MTSHTGTTVAAPAWGAFREAAAAGAAKAGGERGEARSGGLRLRVRERPAAGLGILLAAWVLLWGTFLVAVTPSAGAGSGRTAVVASGSRP
jgi:hypothetical protein